MSTPGFGDIAFASDPGKLFSVEVLNDDVASTNIIFTIREIDGRATTVTNADMADSLDILHLAGSSHVFRWAANRIWRLAGRGPWRGLFSVAVESPWAAPWAGG